jgi:NTE family protein
MITQNPYDYLLGKQMKRIKVGLALSGGGARALVHIGILRTLQEAGVPIDCISGASMGGVIAAAYASGIPIDIIEQKATKLSQMRELVKLIDLTTPRRGLLEGNRIRDFMAELFIDRTFDSLRIPLAIPAVDLIQAREVVFTSGLVMPAVMATIAVPGLFKPVEIGEYRLVDGGILNNLPVDRTRQLGADIVIAVNAQFDPFTQKPWQDLPERPNFPIPLPDPFLDFYRAELIMIAALTEVRLKTACPEILLHPPIPLDITMFMGFTRIPEIIAAGAVSAKEALPAILNLIERKNAELAG